MADDDVGSCIQQREPPHQEQLCAVRHITWCTKASSSRQDQMEIDGEPTVSFARVILCEAEAKIYVRRSPSSQLSELNNKNYLACHSRCCSRLQNLLLLLWWWEGMLGHFVMASFSHHWDYTLLIRINGNPYFSVEKRNASTLKRAHEQLST